MSNLIQQFGGVMGVIATVLFGGFAVYGLFNKNSKSMKQEESNTAGSVINLLKDQVDALEKKVEQQSKDIVDLTKKVETLGSENDTLTKVLQGRDTVTQQFYKDAYAAMELMKSTSASTAKLSESVTKLVTLMDGFMRGNNK